MQASHVALCGANLWGCVGVSAGKCSRNIELGSLDEVGSDLQTWTYEEGMLKSNRNTTSSWYHHSYEKCLAPRYAPEELVDGQVYSLTLERCEESSLHSRFVLEGGRVKSLAPSEVPFCVTIEGSVAMKSAGSRVSLQACDDANAQQQEIGAYGNVESFFSTMQDRIGYEDSLDIIFFDTALEGVDSVLYVYHESDLENSVYATPVSTQSGTISIDAADLGEYHGEFVAVLSDKQVTFSVMDRAHDKRYGCGWGHYSSSNSSTSAWAFGLIFLALIPLACCVIVGLYRQSSGHEDADDKTEASEVDWKADRADEELSQATDSDESSSLHLEEPFDLDLEASNVASEAAK